MKHENDQTPEKSDKNALATLHEGVSAAGDKALVVLSDFDQTLCGEYKFDPHSNSRIPCIDADLIETAKDQTLIIATGRRADSPAVPIMWESGLVRPTMPVITENGGCLVFYNGGDLDFVDLAPQEDLVSLNSLQGLDLGPLPKGQELVFKSGRTMLLVQLRSKEGHIDAQHQDWLAQRLENLVTDPSLHAVNTREGVTIQSRGVNKAAGFRTYLDLVGMIRDELLVVGMGDGLNDAEIFGEANIAVGYHDTVAGLVDVTVGGPLAAPAVFSVLKGASQTF